MEEPKLSHLLYPQGDLEIFDWRKSVMQEGAGLPAALVNTLSGS